MKKHIPIYAGLASIFAILTPLANGALVMGWEFNSDGNQEGWTLAGTTGVSVAGGFISGTASGNDPQFTQGSLSIAPGAGETWTTLTFRVRETQDAQTNAPTAAGLVTEFSNVGLIVSINGGPSSPFSSPSNGTTAGDGWFEVEYDISGFGSGTITSLRVDPIGGAQSNSNSQTDGNAYDVDYIRVSDTAVIPEPSAAILGALGSLLLLRRRR